MPRVPSAPSRRSAATTATAPAKKKKARRSQYGAGRRKEWAICKQLREEGYIAVRTAGSHGLWDVMAIYQGDAHPPHTRLIQSKYSKTGKNYEDDNCRLFRRLRVAPHTFKELWLYVFGTATPRVTRLGTVKRKVVP